VYGVDADIAGLAIGLWFATFADGAGFAAGLINMMTLAGIGPGFAQVVEVADGDAGQCSVLSFTIDPS